MRRQLILSVVALAVAAALIAATPAAAGEPWYSDVAKHWAEGYIRCLWEEGIADGSQEWVWRYHPALGYYQELQSRFYPDQGASRAQYTMLLAKAFRLAPAPGQTGFPDVPVGYQAYPGKDAQPFIDAARLAGLVTGYGDGYFRPAQLIIREEAVAILIRGLGLGPYARSLSPGEIDGILAPFGDAHLVSPALRPEMAVAIRLRIIEGYPTHPRTIQPLNNMTRAEAATIVFRSCLLVLTASPNPFSPDGDGVDDFTLVTVLTLRNRNIRAWEIYVCDGAGQVLRHLGQGGGQPPPVLVWTGIDQFGHVLPDGTYYLAGQVVDGQSQVHNAAWHPVHLLKRGLWGNLDPPLVKPGQSIRVRATTTGGALWVSATPAPAGSILLGPLGPPGNQQNWEATFTVPPDAPDGHRTVTLTAGFDRAQRGLNLTYLVYQPLPLLAWVEPDPAPGGGEAHLWAEAGFPATAVTGAIAGLPTIVLHPVPGQPGRWSGSFPVLPEWPAGPRTALVTGYMPGRSRTVAITFGVEQSHLPELRFFLDD